MLGPDRPMFPRVWASAATFAALLAKYAPPREPPRPGILNISEEQSASFIRNFNPLQFAEDVR